MKLKIEYLAPDELVAYENNAKIHTAEQIEQIKKSIQSVNIYAHILAQKRGEEVNLSCAIGDRRVDGRLYSDIVDIAREYVAELGGFEKLAEWGLI